MSPGSEVEQQMAELKAEFANLKTKFAECEADVRVTKHEVKNMHQMMSGLGTRLDKVEDRVLAKIDSLADKLTGVGMQQARGLGFFAGVAAVITGAGSLLLALGKLLFGAHG